MGRGSISKYCLAEGTCLTCPVLPDVSHGRNAFTPHMYCNATPCSASCHDTLFLGMHDALLALADVMRMGVCRPRTSVVKFFSNNAQKLGLNAIVRKAELAD